MAVLPRKFLFRAKHPEPLEAVMYRSVLRIVNRSKCFCIPSGCIAVVRSDISPKQSTQDSPHSLQKKKKSEHTLPFQKWSGAFLPSFAARGHSSTSSSSTSSHHSSICGSPSSDANTTHSSWSSSAPDSDDSYKSDSTPAASPPQEQSALAPVHSSLQPLASAPTDSSAADRSPSASQPPIDRQSSAQRNTFTSIPKSPIYRQPFYILREEGTRGEGMEEKELAESELKTSERWRLLANTRIRKVEVEEDEKEMDFYHRQLQLYRINQPAGLDNSFCFKWQPSLESIVEFEVDYMPKISAMEGGNLLRMAVNFF